MPTEAPAPVPAPETPKVEAPKPSGRVKIKQLVLRSGCEISWTGPVDMTLGCKDGKLEYDPAARVFHVHSFKVGKAAKVIPVESVKHWEEMDAAVSLPPPTPAHKVRDPETGITTLKSEAKPKAADKSKVKLGRTADGKPGMVMPDGTVVPLT